MSEEVKVALEYIERAGAKQTNYWNILLAVSCGVLTTAGALGSNATWIHYITLIGGYVVFGISNFQAIYRFQKEAVVIGEYLKGIIDDVPETYKVIFDSRTILPVWIVVSFQVTALIIVITLIVFLLSGSAT